MAVIILTSAITVRLNYKTSFYLRNILMGHWSEFYVERSGWWVEQSDLERNDRIPKSLILNVIIMFGGILRTDIVQKTVVGCLWLQFIYKTHVGLKFASSLYTDVVLFPFDNISKRAKE